jgi:hypothetical protein
MNRRGYSRGFEGLTIEQCETLKKLGFPQIADYWYVRMEDNVFVWLSEAMDQIECEKIVACPVWVELQDWLDTEIDLRYLGDEIGLWGTHIENGPEATGKTRIEAAYNIVMMVKQMPNQ